MDDYLMKPVTRRELHTVFRRWLPAAHAPGIETAGEMRDRTTVRAPPISSGDTASGDDAAPILDVGYLVNEVLGGNDEMLPEMLSAFLEELRPQLDSIQSAMQGEDLQKTRETAHAAKGAARTAGAIRLANLCGAIETAVAEETFDQLSSCVEMIEPNFEQVAKEIQSVCEKIPHSLPP